MRTPQVQKTVNRFEMDSDPYKGFEDCVRNSMHMMAMSYLLEIVKEQKEQIESLREEVTIATKNRPVAKRGARVDETEEGSEGS